MAISWGHDFRGFAWEVGRNMHAAGLLAMPMKMVDPGQCAQRSTRLAQLLPQIPVLPGNRDGKHHDAAAVA